MVLYRVVFTATDRSGGQEGCYPNRQPDQQASVQSAADAYLFFDSFDADFARNPRSRARQPQ